MERKSPVLPRWRVLDRSAVESRAIRAVHGASTYARPDAAYIALRQILSHDNVTKALQQLQRDHGGGSITEAQLEAGFQRFLPNQSPACLAHLSQFFTEWFDTAYPAGGGVHRPQITGPGLAGAGFYRPGGGCG
jgi:hypothetical protein